MRSPWGDVQVKRKGTGQIVGSIIAGKKFKGEGPWTFMAYEDSTPIDPTGTRHDPGDLILGISAWAR